MFLSRKQMLSFINKAFVSFSALSHFSIHYKLTFSHRSPHYNANLNFFFLFNFTFIMKN